MSMFNELYELARSATLTMTISADEPSGKLTINIIPKPKKEVDMEALSTPLCLTAVPEEFETGFCEALRGFSAAHRSLAEQAESASELLNAAKAESQRKTTEAVAKASAKKGGRKAGAAAAGQDPSSSGGEDDDDNAGESGGDTQAATAPQASSDGARSGEDAKTGGSGGSEPQLFG